MEDKLTEMLVGEPGAIRLQGALYLGDRGQVMSESKWAPQLMMAGVMVGHKGDVLHPMSNGHGEMWRCDVIIIPWQKFSSHCKGETEHAYAFSGMRLDQVLTHSGWADPTNWGDEYFESAKGK